MKSSFVMYTIVFCTMLCVSESYLSSSTTPQVGGCASFISSLFPSLFPVSSNFVNSQRFEGIEMIQFPYDEEVDTDVESTQAEGECFSCQLLSWLPNLMELIKDQLLHIQEGIEYIHNGVQDWTVGNTNNSSNKQRKASATKSWIHPSERLPVHFWIVQAIQVPLLMGSQQSSKAAMISSATLLLTLAVHQQIEIVLNSFWSQPEPTTTLQTTSTNQLVSPSFNEIRRINVLKYAKTLKVEQVAPQVAINTSNLANMSVSCLLPNVTSLTGSSNISVYTFEKEFISEDMEIEVEIEMKDWPFDGDDAPKPTMLSKVLGVCFLQIMLPLIFLLSLLRFSFDLI